MDPRIVHKKFVFNPELDLAFLYSLYENDYPYIAGVMAEASDDLEAAVPELEQAYHARDLAGIARTIHRIKPLFGYSGLLRHQEKLAGFEDRFRQSQPDEDIGEGFRGLMQTILTGKIILEEDCKRLTLFLQCS